MTLLLAVLISLGVWTPAAAIDIVGNERTDTLDCGGQNVRIGGQRNTITLIGSCPRLDVTGSNNIVKVEALEAVDITGAANTVEWQHSLAGDRPRLSSNGFGNSLVHAEDAPPPPAAEPAPAEAPAADEPMLPEEPALPTAPAESPAGDEPMLPDEPAPPTEIAIEAWDQAIVSFESGQTLNLECGDGGLVMLLGGGNSVTITGTCRGVQVVGAGNQVWIERAHSIEIAGSASTVIWQNGPDDATPPAVIMYGPESIVEQGELP
jgi:hypothetical protein